MPIFVTGSTGYLGSYLVAGLMREHGDSLNLLVREITTGRARAAVEVAATAFFVSGISGISGQAHADFSGRPDRRTFWLVRR